MVDAGGCVTAVCSVVVVVVEDVSGFDAHDAKNIMATTERIGVRMISFFIGLKYCFQKGFVTSPFHRRMEKNYETESAERVLVSV